MTSAATPQKPPATRPLPHTQEHDTAAFWAATKERRLTYQQCDACGTVVWHPRAHCTGCLEGTLSWRTSQGRGAVYSYSVIRQSYHPFFRSKVPFAVAWVDLDEGPRVLTNLTGIADPSRDVKIGMRVVVEWEAHDELAIPLFRPE
ncbi:MAG: OB-fold domain-containing protein [Deltaproteobacteria bacterium]|nr:OB-fold domain-containing protein [Deltaproteobacteria bacterium]